MNVHKNVGSRRAGIESGAGRRPSPKPQASARGPFGSGLTGIAAKDQRDCRIAPPGRIGCDCRRPRRIWRPSEKDNPSPFEEYAQMVLSLVRAAAGVGPQRPRVFLVVAA